VIRLAAVAAALALAAWAVPARADVAAAPELRVRLRSAATVAGGFVRLDEVAELSGSRAGEAAGVLLGRAPATGQSRALTSRAVGLRLEEEGFDARRFELGGAEETVIRPPAHIAALPAPAGRAPAAKAAAVPAASPTQSGGELRDLAAGWLRSALAERLKCPIADVDVKVESARAAGASEDFRSAKAEVQWTGERVRLGRQSAAIALSVGEKSLGRLQVYFDAAVLRTVPVASRDLPVGKVLAAEDVAQARVRLADLSMEIPTDAGRLTGMIVTRAVQAGAPMDARGLGRRMVVRRGQPVTLVSEAGGARITETAVARSDGALGDAVVVERQGAQKQQLTGRAAGQGLVRME
jgi:flagella basal body P-ring formation protein FlgA